MSSLLCPQSEGCACSRTTERYIILEKYSDGVRPQTNTLELARLSETSKTIRHVQVCYHNINECKIAITGGIEDRDRLMRVKSGEQHVRDPSP